MRERTDKGSIARVIGRARPLACAAVVVLAATACAGDPSREQGRAGSPQATAFAGLMARLFDLDPAGEPDGPAPAVRRASRSIWGVVPDPPRRKADLRPELIKGSAVAIAGDTLLASCRVIGGRRQVGLVRHNKYYRGHVIGAGADGQICILRAPQAPLQATGGFRRFADLRAGEPIVAVVNRTSAELALASGWLAAKGGGGRSDPVLETTLSLPAETLSAVLFDARGNLIGLGSAGPVAASVVLGVPVTASLAPQLAQKDLGASPALLASLEPAPRQRPRRPVLLLRTDRDGDGPSPAVVAAAGGSSSSGSRAGGERDGVAPGGGSSGQAGGTDVHGGADHDRAAGAGAQGKARGGGQGRQGKAGGSGAGHGGQGGDDHGGRGRGGHGGRGRGGDDRDGGHGRGGHGGEGGRGGHGNSGRGGGGDD